MFYPAPFLDEAWMASRAWGFLHTGLNYGPLDSGVSNTLPGYWTFFPLTPTLIHAAFAKIFGFSLASLRLASLFAGIGLLAAVWIITHRLSGSRVAGWVAVLLTTTSIAFTYSAHLVRPDILVSALGFGALALMLSNDSPSPGWRDFAAGVMLGFAFEIHINAAVFGPVLLFAYVTRQDWKRFPIKQTALFAFGLALMLALYFGLHIARYPSTYNQMGDFLRHTHTPPIISGDLGTLLESLGDMIPFFLIGTAARVLVLPVAVFLAIKGDNAGTRLALLLLLIAALAFALAVTNKKFYYSVLIAPFTDIAMACVLNTLFAEKPRTWLMRRAKALSVATIAASLVFGISMVYLGRNHYEFNRVVERIQRVGPPSAIVLGPGTFWLSQEVTPYYHWFFLIEYPRRYPGSTIGDAISAIRPDVLVVDGLVRAFVLQDGENNASQYQLERRIPKEELIAFLSCRAELTETIPTLDFGDVQIYRIDWTKPGNACP
jgi:4-amino-4-deoxy-L-arabinose transferase-like glycosyltransferase